MTVRTGFYKFMGIIILFAITAGVLYFYAVPSELFKPGRTISEPLPPAGSRVLIFAPHNDDETLGTGIFINRALKAGRRVKVVLVTNGDGFTAAVDEEFFTMHPSSREYREFGLLRQRETVKALKLLGLSERDVIFLGYPDGGTAHLWTEFWDPEKKYFSRFTQTDVSPYRNSFDRNEPYTGANLLANIEQVFKDYKPTHIYFPHPNDRHPDHWGVNAFVKFALEETGQTNVKQYLYLVHRGNWPKPRLPRPSERLYPPDKLKSSGTAWRQFVFRPGESELKQKAIAQYATQVKVMSGFLFAFVRASELFGEYPDVLVTGKKEKGLFTRDEPVIIDPQGDFVTGDVDRAADITGIYSYLDDRKWIIEVASAGQVSRDIIYRLHARIFPNKGDIRRFDLNYHNGRALFRVYAKNSFKTIPGVKNEIINGRWRITVPLSEVKGMKAAFVNADSSIGHFTVDKTAWRMLKFK